MIYFPLKASTRLLTLPSATLPLVSFHTTSQVGRWYRHLLHVKPPPVPPNPALSFPEDWECQPYKPKPPDAISDAVKRLPGFADLNADVQKVFSTEYGQTAKEFEEQLNEKLRELGYHPTDISAGAQVVRMTVKIRQKKWMIQKHPRNLKLFRATRALVRARWRTLRLLRGTNMPEFLRLCEALNITGYLHRDPFDCPTTDPTVLRKRAVREECHRSRLLKLANCKLSLSIAERDFYKRKQEKLEKLLDQLASLELSATTDDPVNDKSTDTESAGRRERAKLALQQLFDETIEARQNEVLRPVEEDELSWYKKEQQIRESYLAKEAEKAERQLRKKH